MTLGSVCVYCGSSDRIEAHYLEAAEAMGVELAQRDITVIYGGGSTGMMGSLANSALQAGGRVIGVLPHFFDTPELAHYELTELVRVDNMHQRKAKMAELADGFIALPGGFGTYEELFEILTWAQIGLHHHPVGVLNVDGYFEPLFDLIEHAERHGFIYSEHRQLLSNEASPAALLEAMDQYQPPEDLKQWVERRKESE